MRREREFARDANLTVSVRDERVSDRQSIIGLCGARECVRICIYIYTYMRVSRESRLQQRRRRRREQHIHRDREPDKEGRAEQASERESLQCAVQGKSRRAAASPGCRWRRNLRTRGSESKDKAETLAWLACDIACKRRGEGPPRDGEIRTPGRDQRSLRKSSGLQTYICLTFDFSLSFSFSFSRFTLTLVLSLSQRCVYMCATIYRRLPIHHQWQQHRQHQQSRVSVSANQEINAAYAGTASRGIFLLIARCCRYIYLYLSKGRRSGAQKVSLLPRD